MVWRNMAWHGMEPPPSADLAPSKNNSSPTGGPSCRPPSRASPRRRFPLARPTAPTTTRCNRPCLESPTHPPVGSPCPGQPARSSILPEVGRRGAQPQLSPARTQFRVEVSSPERSTISAINRDCDSRSSEKVHSTGCSPNRRAFDPASPHHNLARVVGLPQLAALNLSNDRFGCHFAL